MKGSDSPDSDQKEELCIMAEEMIAGEIGRQVEVESAGDRTKAVAKGVGPLKEVVGIITIDLQSIVLQADGRVMLPWIHRIDLHGITVHLRIVGTRLINHVVLGQAVPVHLQIVGTRLIVTSLIVTPFIVTLLIVPHLIVLVMHGRAVPVLLWVVVIRLIHPYSHLVIHGQAVPLHQAVALHQAVPLHQWGHSHLGARWIRLVSIGLIIKSIGL